MAKPAESYFSEEFTQSLLEKQIREQCELHEWATVSTSNPIDILMLEEEEGVDINYNPKVSNYR